MSLHALYGQCRCQHFIMPASHQWSLCESSGVVTVCAHCCGHCVCPLLWSLLCPLLLSVVLSCLTRLNMPLPMRTPLSKCTLLSASLHCRRSRIRTHSLQEMNTQFNSNSNSEGTCRNSGREYVGTVGGNM